MKFFTAFLIVFTLGCLSSSQAQQIITLQPGPDDGQDAMVCVDPLYNKENRNYGDSPQLLAHAWTNGGKETYARSYIRFDLSAYTSMDDLDTAYLYLYNNPEGEFDGKHQALYYNANGTSGVPKNTGVVRRIVEPWDEHTITWNTRPAGTAQNAATIPAPMVSNKDFKVNVTALIRDMYASETPKNFGFLIRIRDEIPYTALVLTSSNYYDSSRRPKLELHFDSATDRDGPEQPAHWEFSCYPNPIPAGHPATVIFSLPSAQNISLALYDVLGREVTGLAKGSYTRGTYTVPVRKTDLTPGFYAFRLTANDKTMTRMVLIQ